MIWFLLIVLIMAFLMGFFQVPILIMYGILAVLFIIFLMRNPLLFGKDPEKMLATLRKSKRPFFQFLYHFLDFNWPEAEKAIERIRPGSSKTMAEIMLLLEQKQYGRAKELLSQMRENKSKWYAFAYIAINEDDVEAFKQHKGKIKDHFLLKTLEVDQAVHDGRRDEAIAMLEAIIPKLRGLKLLSSVRFHKQIQEGRI
ncbi:hypothetical protein [Bacillus sp. FJAT-29814]|uniref:hypothetical protein n=1 Tax=Bacillus sp. FJAT-29814 TaxID=1729688 RepID=UPI00082BAF13|nr:hypothetical protein [Bacillus sp. FJAT-29814]